MASFRDLFNRNVEQAQAEAQTKGAAATAEHTKQLSVRELLEPKVRAAVLKAVAVVAEHKYPSLEVDGSPALRAYPLDPINLRAYKAAVVIDTSGRFARDHQLATARSMYGVRTEPVFTRCNPLDEPFALLLSRAEITDTPERPGLSLRSDGEVMIDYDYRTGSDDRTVFRFKSLTEYLAEHAAATLTEH